MTGDPPEASGTNALELSGVVKHFDEVVAVGGLDLALRRGEFLTLLGPSGCGKTTALRVIAGFEVPNQGVVRFQGEDVTSWSPQRRGFGMVFQNYALFPHLNVFENVAFGLRTRKRPGAEIRDSVERALAKVDLPGYEDRAVQALSGGQQQRVALARALAIEPPLLLLDEPLSNLDAALREKTRTELRTLVKDLGITAIFVTHDQEEAFDLSDRIAVMRTGLLEQIGTPDELYQRPANRFVAGFVGRANTLPAIVAIPPGGEPVAQLKAGPCWPLDADADLAVSPGQEAVVMVRPEGLRMTDEDDEDTLEGVVRDRRFRGVSTTYFVEVGGVGELEIVADGGGPAAGSPVRVGIKPGADLHLFPSELD